MSTTAPRRHSKKYVRKTKAERQREIVDATVQLVGRYGVQGTTVSRIAAAVGMARGALYQHFPNREAVLEAALETWGERSSAWMAQTSTADAPARLLQMGKAHSSWAMSEYNSFVRPFYQLIASNQETRLAKRITERQQEDFHYLVALVEEGKRQGTIRDDVDSGDVAWSLLLHAWGEDIARLMGVDQFITGGASHRILARLVATYARDAGTPPAPDGPGHET
jgi:AcrR family transcriptional regulator